MNSLDPLPEKWPPSLPPHRRIGVLRWIWYGIEIGVLLVFFVILRLMPHGWAVRAMAGLGGLVGPRLKASNRIRRNLALIYPQMETAGQNEIISGVWRSLGPMMPDYIHRKSIQARPEAIEIIGGEHVDALRGKPAFFFSGHLSTFEVARYAARRHGVGLNLIYRAFNNPLADAMAWRLMWSPDAYVLHKNDRSGIDLLRLIRKDLPIFMLVDQRLRSGIDVPFLGQPAQSPHAMATLALKYNLPMVPVHVERIGDTRFRVTFEPPLDVPRTGDRDTDIRAITLAANQRIGAWINQCPEQWLWLHRRWPDLA